MASASLAADHTLVPRSDNDSGDVIALQLDADDIDCNDLITPQNHIFNFRKCTLEPVEILWSRVQKSVCCIKYVQNVYCIYKILGINKYSTCYTMQNSKHLQRQQTQLFSQVASHWHPAWPGLAGLALGPSWFRSAHPCRRLQGSTQWDFKWENSAKIQEDFPVGHTWPFKIPIFHKLGGDLCRSSMQSRSSDMSDKSLSSKADSG